MRPRRHLNQAIAVLQIHLRRYERQESRTALGIRALIAISLTSSLSESCSADSLHLASLPFRHSDFLRRICSRNVNATGQPPEGGLHAGRPKATSSVDPESQVPSDTGPRPGAPRLAAIAQANCWLNMTPTLIKAYADPWPSRRLSPEYVAQSIMWNALLKTAIRYPITQGSRLQGVAPRAGAQNRQGLLQSLRLFADILRQELQGQPPKRGSAQLASQLGA